MTASSALAARSNNQSGIGTMWRNRRVLGASLVGTAVEFYDFATGKRKILMPLEKPSSYGLALSPDGRSLLHPLVEHVSNNLMLVERYR